MTLGYMAGFFDGEGCVNMARCRTSTFPRVLLVNTNREILEEFQLRFGGDIKRLPLRRHNWKSGWQWRLSWAKAVNFLDSVYRHLRLKRKQAQTVFAWAAIAPGSGGRYRKWDMEALDLIVERMHWLNRKGENVDTPDPVDDLLKAGKSNKGK